MSLQMAEIDRLEVFEAGTHRGTPWTEGDLEEITRNFEALKDVVKPTLIIGHDEDQKLLKDSGLFAAGWLTSLKKAGMKLVSAAKDVPKVVAELINKGAYRRVSAEIYTDFEHGGRRYGKVLRRVALLGGELPQVKTLQDVKALYGELGDQETEWVSLHEATAGDNDTPPKRGKEEPTMGTFTQEQVDKLVDAAVAKEKAATEKRLKAEHSEELKTKTEEITKLKEENEKLARDVKKHEESASEAKSKAERADCESFAEGLCKEGKLAPAVKAATVSAMLALDDSKKTEKFGEGDKSEEVTPREAFKRSLKSSPVVVSFKEEAHTPKQDEDESDIAKLKERFGENVDEERLELLAKVQKYQDDNKIKTFDEAFNRFSREHPEEVK